MINWPPKKQPAQPLCPGPPPKNGQSRRKKACGKKIKSTVNSLGEPTWTAGPFQFKPAVNRAMSAPAASGPEFVPSSPELRSDTPRVGTNEAVTVATTPFPSGEVTPFQPCPPQNVDVCPACLDPVVLEGAGPATACRWPVCGHSYHALCLVFFTHAFFRR